MRETVTVEDTELTLKANLKPAIGFHNCNAKGCDNEFCIGVERTKDTYCPEHATA